MTIRRRRLALTSFAAIGAVIGCGTSSPKHTTDAGLFVIPPTDGSADVSAVDVTSRDSTAPEAARDAGVVDASPAARNPSCTPLRQQTGTAIDTMHGRLDGTVVFVLPLGGPRDCNGDESHVHLQIQVSSAIYDVAIDIGTTAANDEVGYDEVSMALPGGAWSEGWHGGDDLAYPALGLHSPGFMTLPPDQLAEKVETLLTGVTQISVFCTGYSQENGCHDVHFKDGSGDDGAIVLNPEAVTPSILFFRFVNQTF